MLKGNIDPTDKAFAIIKEENAIHDKVQQALDCKPSGVPMGNIQEGLDTDLLALRDEIAHAKQEDKAPIIEQMTRIAAVRGTISGIKEPPADIVSPYFAHIALQEENKRRDVLIGKRGFIDRSNDIQIVDWRNAPISKIYYRYAEDDDYEEKVAGRVMSGVLAVRRNISIIGRILRRIGTPKHGIFVKDVRGNWNHSDDNNVPVLQGGACKVTKVSSDAQMHLGLEDRQGHVHRINKELPEIAALIDPVQFELITKPNSGLIVIQGAAGSGKTTVALHRIAYLNFQDPERFAANKILIVVPTQGLARYVGSVLPQLGVEHVAVRTYQNWAYQCRCALLPDSNKDVIHDIPFEVSFVKKHPLLLDILDRYVKDNPSRDNDIISDWASVMTDKSRLLQGFALAEDVTERMIEDTVLFCTKQTEDPQAAMLDSEGQVFRGVDDHVIDQDLYGFDVTDDSILLRLIQLRHGELICSGRRWNYEHIAIDEAQDRSAIEIQVLLGATKSYDQGRSVTIAGDTAQRFAFDNSFVSWQVLLAQSGYGDVAVSPLKLSYRSTAEIMTFTHEVLGPMLAPKDPLIARTSQVPVTVHDFNNAGSAADFVGEALRSLMQREATASVAVIARYSEQAKQIYDSLVSAEVPKLRHIVCSEFSFTPGIDVTDISQVKGLEFDYVILMGVNSASYPDSLEARHSLHIGASRSIHQLWVVVDDCPSPLIPKHYL